MVRTYTRLERRLEQELEGLGLSLAQFDVLATLGRGEGITQQELAQRLLVTKGNVCGLIDRLEASGWVERRPDPDDRRVNRLFLTRRGKARLVESFPQQHAVVKALMSALSAGELQTFYQLLDRLEDSMED
jgi:DNA-binding MarR family transcriptional regulator